MKLVVNSKYCSGCTTDTYKFLGRWNFIKDTFVCCHYGEVGIKTSSFLIIIAGTDLRDIFCLVIMSSCD